MDNIMERFIIRVLSIYSAFFMFYFTQITNGQCIVGGVTYLNHTVWQHDPCTVCACQDAIPVCESVQCRLQACDFSKGQYFRLRPANCCPECVSPGRVCVHQGTSILHNTEWRVSACETCYCEDGITMCTNTSCDENSECNPGEVSQVLPGHCCPVCVPAGRSCSYLDQTYADGSEWSPAACSRCTCLNGRSHCYTASCPNLICSQDEDLSLEPGECCPQCVAQKCSEGDMLYKSTEVWKRDRCTHCVCQSGQQICVRQTCTEKTAQCSDTEHLIWKEDQCCPICVSNEDSCEYEGSTHFDQEVWSTSECEFCVCQRGEVQCGMAHCEHQKCHQNEELITRPDACCPICVTKAICYHGNKTYKNGESWHLGSCRYCECQQGSVQCYQQMCERCPVSTVRIHVVGHCCGQCKPVTCDDECGSCGPSHPSFCLVCKDPSHKLENGKCREQCSDDYFLSSDNTCQACYSSCSSCTSGTQYHCTICKSGFYWRDGECVTSCGAGYVQKDDKCVACHSSCSECSGEGPRRCLTCRDPWKLVRMRQCVEICGSGFYRHGSSCHVCDGKCYPCSGMSTDCTSCSDTTVLQGLVCVPHCDTGYYLTSDNTTCQACPRHCLTCSPDGACLQCNRRTFLSGIKCVARCHGDLPLPDSSTRRCEEASLQPPELFRNNSIEGRAGAFSVITPTMLQAYDDNTPFHELTFHVIQPPSHGDLVLAGSGRDVILQKKSTFTPDNLLSGRLRYLHNRDAPLKDSLEIYVTEKHLGSNRQTVPITVNSHRNPVVKKNRPLHVDQGGEIAIDAQHLDVMDDDSPGSLTLRVIEGPLSGVLRDGVESEGDTVSEDVLSIVDLRAGRYRYKHDDSDTTHDHIVLQASDGQNTINFLFNIEIALRDSYEPVLIHNLGMYLSPGESVPLTSEILKATIRYGKEQDLEYTLTPPTNNPKQGELLMVVPMPGGGATEGWMDVGEDLMGSTVFSFKQRDIDDNRIWYRHNGLFNHREDFFIFQVSDNNNPPNVLRDQEFDITITTAHADSLDEHGTVNEEGYEYEDYEFEPYTIKFAYAAPTQYPVDEAVMGMTVLENQLVPIDSMDLIFEERPSDSSGLRYHITQPLVRGEGSIEHRDRPFESVSEFRQRDLKKQKIIYRPPVSEMGKEEKKVHFKFVALDDEAGTETAEYDFNIRVMPVDNMPPHLALTEQVSGVTQGGTLPLTTTLLSVSDPDTSLGHLIFHVNKSPDAGNFLRRNKNNTIVLKAGDNFTYAQALQEAFYYKHDGSDILEDTIEVSIQDEGQSVTLTLLMDIIEVDKQAPKPVPSATMTMMVSEGGSSLLNANIIAFTDEDTDDDFIRLTLASEPDYGGLYIKETFERLQVGHVLTQQDFKDETIRYIAEEEIGVYPVSEVIYFNVTDITGNTLPRQLLSVTVLPENNQPPVVAVGEAIQVDEGGHAQLVLNNMLITDVDTSMDKIKIVIEASPIYGVIENTRQDISTQKTIVMSFTLADLLDGNIHYVQSHHLKVEPTEDHFVFYVTDGVNQSPSYSLNISIKPQNDEAPLILIEQIHCQENSGVLIDNTTIYVDDFDNEAQEISFTVDSVPEHGHLRLKMFSQDSFYIAPILENGDQFTYQDILSGKLVYTHDGSATAEDTFDLRVTDGVFEDFHEYKVIIGLANDETPRVEVNRGLQVEPGSTTMFTPNELIATDIDSEDSELTYLVTKAPAVGHLQRKQGRGLEEIHPLGQINSFTQGHLNAGYVQYTHGPGEESGVFPFMFSLSDPHGNVLTDQVFTITVLGDRIPPQVDTNEQLEVQEGMSETISTDFLSASDVNSDSDMLQYTVIEPPDLGHIAFAHDLELEILDFTQTDLAARSVMYVHTSDEELYMDSFVFGVSDGTSQITQTFYISVLPMDDSLPTVFTRGMKVQEGVRKLITEFELKASDSDTKDDHVTFTVMEPPKFGILEKVKKNGKLKQVSRFTMEDIYENRISYKHTGGDSRVDWFSFIVSDGTNKKFTVDGQSADRATLQPQEFTIDVTTVDDDTPILQTNLGIHYLEYDFVDGKPMNFITDKELLVIDGDTPPSLLTYHVTQPPQHGRLERLTAPDLDLNYFTQNDLNSGAVRYILTGNSSSGRDVFWFDVMDSKPNILQSNKFHVQWSTLEFEQPSFNITETAGVIRVPVIRTGNLKQYSVVTCETFPGSAVDGGFELKKDFVAHSGQIQFEEWQAMKTCVITVTDDTVYEGEETFTVLLKDPAYALLGQTAMTMINIFDLEDEPVIEFSEAVFTVNETSGFLEADLVRTGDLSQTVSVICYTRSMTATGNDDVTPENEADYITRPQSEESRVVFLADSSTAACRVKILDDTVFETSEQLQILLSDSSAPSRIGQLNKATITIDGPNDASALQLTDTVYFVDEGAGRFEITVQRLGTDLSHISSVWCATRMTDPPSAMPGQDYIPTSSELVFEPGDTTQVCSLEVLDDVAEPQMEGNETFLVFLSSPVGSVLTEPRLALIIINDTISDVPIMSFEKASYVCDEKSGKVHVPVTRTGDLTWESSVVCYTRQQSALVDMDYIERSMTDASRITFKPGQRVVNCSVDLVNDDEKEEDETFLLKLGLPSGDQVCGASIGLLDTATITIADDSDIPRIQLQHSAYSVQEPSNADEKRSITVELVRHGDKNHTTGVRTSTRDGSAISGIDYSANSQMIWFKPGESMKNFTIDILFNPDVEWHETFTVVLGPHAPANALFGNTTVTTVTILDNQVSGSLVLPAPPQVVSLMHYDSNEESQQTDNPSPGYPLVCVTPCDPHFSTYSKTGKICNESGINHTAMQYRWEVAVPMDTDGSRPPFKQITDSTVFTTADRMVLDSIYFRPKFNVRCVAQPLHSNGHLGVPLRSKAVEIGSDNGLCHTPITAGSPHGFHAQSFMATSEYIEPTDPEHPNTIHISVMIPHQDGLLPLLSTFPIHNLRLLLSEPVYREQHTCSNFVLPSHSKQSSHYGFLDEDESSQGTPEGMRNVPHQFDTALRSNETVMLYRHLDLAECTWQFDAWYHMTELVDHCGGAVISDFEVRNAARSHLSLQLPLYVSYLYASAPTGWSALEHRTEMDFSFFYDTVQWKAGLETDGQLSGRIQILKVFVNNEGKLVVDFKTEAKFRGQYVLEHDSNPDVKSEVLAPVDLPLTFDLSLIWSQQTYDGPSQVWRAISDFNLKDYSGEYQVNLVPCTVTPTQEYKAAGGAALLCEAKTPQTFSVPLSFQQTSRPVPLAYSLDTDFLLTNSEREFSSNPFLAQDGPRVIEFEQVESYTDKDEEFYQSQTVPPMTQDFEQLTFEGEGKFLPDDTIYGRVMWNTGQDLESAYNLQIEKLFLCTGQSGYIPTYDPTGDVYGEGQQFGCLEPGANLKYRFLVLDRGDPDAVDRHFNQIPFDARFISQNPEYLHMQDWGGIDGFTMDVSPLYKIDSGNQWYLQVIYNIGLAGDAGVRYQRSVSHKLPHSRQTRAQPENKQQNGTNMNFIKFNSTALGASGQRGEQQSGSVKKTVVPAVCVSIVLLVFLFCIIFMYRRRRRDRKREVECTPHSYHVKVTSCGTSTCATLRTQPTRTKETRSTTLPANRMSTYDNVRPANSKATIKIRRAQKTRWSLRPKSGTEV